MEYWTIYNHYNRNGTLVGSVPGRLPENITLEKLLSGEYVSETRNKKVASMFKEAQLIEKYGSGIMRILEAFKDYGLKVPKFENFQHGFKVTVYANSLKNEEVNEGVSEGVYLLLDLIESLPGIRIPFYSKKLEIPVKTIERWLKILRRENRITFKGAPKTGGYWKIEE